ncbi:MAG: hypothetical protein HYZ44_15310 [Bacteroidetes bacterium]|nr:hypothetical protein [Bacteroidota bacterium]
MTKSRWLIFLIPVVLLNCNSTHTLYRSPGSKESSWIINAFTLNHCGCTQLFAEKYKNRNREFQIMYTDDFAHKTIYNHDDKGVITDTIVLVAKKEGFAVPFDSLDNEIFGKIKTIITNREGLIYDIKWTEYKGYVQVDL